MWIPNNAETSSPGYPLSRLPVRYEVCREQAKSCARRKLSPPERRQHYWNVVLDTRKYVSIVDVQSLRTITLGVRIPPIYPEQACRYKIAFC